MRETEIRTINEGGGTRAARSRMALGDVLFFLGNGAYPHKPKSQCRWGPLITGAKHPKNTPHTQTKKKKNPQQQKHKKKKNQKTNPHTKKKKRPKKQDLKKKEPQEKKNGVVLGSSH